MLRANPAPHLPGCSRWAAGFLEAQLPRPAFCSPRGSQVPLESRSSPQPPLLRTNDTQRESPALPQSRENLGQKDGEQKGRERCVRRGLSCSQLEQIRGKRESPLALEQVINHFYSFHLQESLLPHPTHGPQAGSPQSAGGFLVSCEPGPGGGGGGPGCWGPGLPAEAQAGRVPSHSHPLLPHGPIQQISSPRFGLCLPSLLL